MGKRVAVVGATGVVGRKMVEVLLEYDFPVSDWCLLASSRSAGQEITISGQTFTVEELKEDSFEQFHPDVTFFSAGGEVSKHFAPLAVDAGSYVIDNSSYFRMTDGVPLVVPEVNFEVLTPDDHLIANPNCSTIQSVVPLKPLLDHFGLERVSYTTYQAVSGSGKKGLDDLENGTTTAYPHPIVNNVLPHIDVFQEDGYTKEEHKMINETRKIINQADLRVTATTARVPVQVGHAVSFDVQLSRDFDLDEVRQAFDEAEGIILRDDPANNVYPLETEAAETDPVYVGRIRRDPTLPNGLHLWSVADNLRKGAASNSVQIAQRIYDWL